MIHLVFGRSARSGLKHAFRKQNHKVIGFPIDFSVGPIKTIHEERGINHYFSWVNSSFQSVLGSFEDGQTCYRQSLQELSEVDDGEHVTIWTCENASEQVGLRISCSLLKDKNVDLKLVNTFTAMDDYMKHEDVRMEIRSTGDCNAEQLTHFYKHSTVPLSEEMRNDYVQEGERLLRSKSMVRSWRQGEIVDDLETRDDAFILECTRRVLNEIANEEFILATRVIGTVMADSEQSLSDVWIAYRIRSLIHSHQLAYEGSLQSMRLLNIKVV
ncbi:DUF1835 domain-containing protein [Shouchella shacheensis]|uniref:DUF1835 domain-containing protein n=1 Tax=Shouchella shacheensis TaxID=1649580 RepID=UPI0007400C70|nr:DUF1835 domain-containing protein [Shouchella shacheensis]